MYVGYEHYEVSNYAQPGRRSQHNQKYWRNEPFWGFGMGAASYVRLDQLIILNFPTYLPTITYTPVYSVSSPFVLYCIGLLEPQNIHHALVVEWQKSYSPVDNGGVCVMGRSSPFRRDDHAPSSSSSLGRWKCVGR